MLWLLANFFHLTNLVVQKQLHKVQTIIQQSIVSLRLLRARLQFEIQNFFLCCDLFFCFWNWKRNQNGKYCWNHSKRWKSRIKIDWSGHSILHHCNKKSFFFFLFFFDFIRFVVWLKSFDWNLISINLSRF